MDSQQGGQGEQDAHYLSGVAMPSATESPIRSRSPRRSGPGTGDDHSGGNASLACLPVGRTEVSMEASPTRTARSSSPTPTTTVTRGSGSSDVVSRSHASGHVASMTDQGARPSGTRASLATSTSDTGMLDPADIVDPHKGTKGKGSKGKGKNRGTKSTDSEGVDHHRKGPGSPRRRPPPAGASRSIKDFVVK